MIYAGQRKIGRDIDRKLAAEKARKKSNAKKAKLKEALYYARLKKLNPEPSILDFYLWQFVLGHTLSIANY